MNDNEQTAIKSLERIAIEGINEQKRARRWNIFFRLLFVLIGVFVLMGVVGGIANQGQRLTTASEFTAVVDVKGVIMDGAEASLDVVGDALNEAFADSRTKGVVLRINSPGGSAVQSAMIYDEILRLRAEYPDIPVYAVIEDVGASGGYYIAAAASEIFANKSSIVGSIGVRLESFGVVEAAKKLGIESRQVTAGKHKAMLDPFRPVSETEVEHLKSMLASTHQQFIDAVKQGRGDRLADSDDVFSGLFWAGVAAKDLGLVDDFKTVNEVARDLIGVEETINFIAPKTLLDKLSGQVRVSARQAIMEMQLSPNMRY